MSENTSEQKRPAPFAGLLDIFRSYNRKVNENPMAYRVTVWMIAAALSGAFLIVINRRNTGATIPQLLCIWGAPFLAIVLNFFPFRIPSRSPFFFYRCLYALFFLLYGFYPMSIFKELEMTWEIVGILAIYWALPPFCYAALFSVHRNLCHAAEKGKTIGKLWLTFWMTLCPVVLSDKTEQPPEKLKKRTVTLAVVLFLLAFAVFGTALYLRYYFKEMDIETILFTVRFANNNFTKPTVISALLTAAAVLVLTLTFFLLLRWRSRRDFSIHSPDGSRTVSVTRTPALLHISMGVLVVAAVAFLLYSIDTGAYLYRRFHTSNFYETYYVTPTADRYSFPEEKKNLVFLYLESYENAFTSTEKGGCQEKDYMPELSALAAAPENVNFSHSELQGGQSVFNAATWYTMGATVAMTSGVPLSTLNDRQFDDLNTNNTMGQYRLFLPSLIRLENILHDEGYEQLCLTGASKSFSGFGQFIGRYSDSTVCDHNDAIEEGLIPDGYKENWGIEDKTLFEIAQKKVTALAEQERPFAFTMYTMDTHGLEGGYRCPDCDPQIADNYRASVRCTSRHASEFLAWLQKQDFYEDTVVIIVGDHILATAYNYPDAPSDYTRTSYNCFIHAQKSPQNTKNRVFAAMDMFPTTLSALGVTIEDDRLGLGTDLFSGRQTLCEELGKDELLRQISLNSDYYNTEFWKDDFVLE